jgi:hypothetical protein
MNVLQLVGLCGFSFLFILLLINFVADALNKNKPYLKTVMLNGKPYIFNKLIFRSAFIIIFSLFIFSIIRYGSSDNIYYRCSVGFGFNGSAALCDNPFYLDKNFIGKVPSEMSFNKTLPKGYTFGKPAPFLFDNFTEIILSLLALSFLLNHLIYNSFPPSKDGGIQL